jgi:isoaspartyl peptidase/L-asparaginase-like protein (Ntn-hydrolase superfamily)
MLATWSFGAAALEAAWPGLIAPGGNALDAVEAACRHAEADRENHTVGVGGLPDRDGHLTLDAAVMLSPAQSGAVCAVRGYPHPISIARRVMACTAHKLLAGAGAEKFAAEQGFKRARILTAEARRHWAKWKTVQAIGPIPNIEEARNAHHDTIGVLALDASGVLAAGCSTSGLAFKLPGRVGDSPIVGHGLYAEPNVGACVCTGHGELVSGVSGAFLAVELLRRGATPLDAAGEVLRRIQNSYSLTERDQVGIIVLNESGVFAGAGLRPGFKIAVRTVESAELLDPEFVLLP